jgi:hypothetical protein
MNNPITITVCQHDGSIVLCVVAKRFPFNLENQNIHNVDEMVEYFNNLATRDRTKKTCFAECLKKDNKSAIII